MLIRNPCIPATISGDFRKEDLAAAVVQLISDEGGQFAFHMARNCNVKHVIACGSFFNHPMAWRRLAGSFLNESVGMPDKVCVNIVLCS